MSNKYLLVAPANGKDVAVIVVNNTNVGVSWRTAKKQLRQWYLQQAKNLRDVSCEEYFSK